MYDTEDTGFVKFSDFVHDLVGESERRRRAILRKIYDELDTNGDSARCDFWPRSVLAKISLDA